MKTRQKGKTTLNSCFCACPGLLILRCHVTRCVGFCVSLMDNVWSFSKILAPLVFRLCTFDAELKSWPSHCGTLPCLAARLSLDVGWLFLLSPAHVRGQIAPLSHSPGIQTSQHCHCWLPSEIWPLAFLLSASSPWDFNILRQASCIHSTDVIPIRGFGYCT